jgi:hypothetical protein
MCNTIDRHCVTACAQSFVRQALRRRARSAARLRWPCIQRRERQKSATSKAKTMNATVIATTSASSTRQLLPAQDNSATKRQISQLLVQWHRATRSAERQRQIVRSLHVAGGRGKRALTQLAPPGMALYAPS